MQDDTAGTDRNAFSLPVLYERAQRCGERDSLRAGFRRAGGGHPGGRSGI